MKFIVGRFDYRMFIVSLLTALAGCATVPTESNWPAASPPIAYFESIYAADPVNQQVQSQQEYLTWVVRFYRGWELYRQGWHDITEQLVGAADYATDREHIQETMARLGKTISAEWAKDSKDRKIFTPTIVAWGTALQRNTHEGGVIELLQRVEHDVEALFAGGLQPKDISLERYLDDQEENEFF